LQVRDSGQRLDLVWDRNLLGRLSEADNIKPEVDLSGFDNSGVSRRHAQVTRTEGQVYLEDLDSANGTFLNEVRLQPGLQHPLKHQDEVRLGSLRMVYLQNESRN
jgi:hypothetical protein